MASRPKALRRQSGAPTISHVADLAGVSVMTVSRVINQDPVVKPETLERVRGAIKTLNYVPNSAARSLAAADATRLAFFYSNPSSSYLSEFLVGILDELGQSNVQMIIEKSEMIADHIEPLNRLIAARADGVILPPPLSDQGPVIDRIRQAGLNVVAVGVKNPDISSVTIDDFSAAFEMTSRLIGFSHKRIGFITGDMNHAASHERLRGYQAALSQHGLERDDQLIKTGHYTFASGIEAARALIQLDQRPTAIFASNDEMAAASIAVAHQGGLDVPKDISICGFDDTLLATTIWPSITTIHQPIADMSKAAVGLLLRDIRARRSHQSIEPEHKVLPHSLVARESDGPPPKTRKPLRT